MSTDLKLLRHNFYVFRIDERLFGIDIDCIHEVKDVQTSDEVTPLPHAQSAVLGYVNVRGTVRQVVSLRRMMGNMSATIENGGVIIYCKENVATDTGIYSDHPGEIISVDDKDIDRWEVKRIDESHTASERADFMACGACRTQRGIITLLDPNRLYQLACSF